MWRVARSDLKHRPTLPNLASETQCDWTTAQFQDAHITLTIHSQASPTLASLQVGGQNIHTEAFASCIVQVVHGNNTDQAPLAVTTVYYTSMQQHDNTAEMYDIVTLSTQEKGAHTETTQNTHTQCVHVEAWPGGDMLCVRHAGCSRDAFLQGDDGAGPAWLLPYLLGKKDSDDDIVH